jgi:chromate reductase, NAD(P)H dehydrogenase (quinone)
MTTRTTIRILAVSGSLRAASSNTTLLRAAQALAPAGVEITLYPGMAELPHFNPDLEGAEPPSVHTLRASLQAADAVLFSSPEYAHGVPGSLKNLLDWVVGSGELVGKPVALLQASPYGQYVRAALLETLAVMEGRVIDEASIDMSFGTNQITREAIVAEHAAPVRAAVEALARSVRPAGESASP